MAASQSPRLRQLRKRCGLGRSSPRAARSGMRCCQRVVHAEQGVTELTDRGSHQTLEDRYGRVVTFCANSRWPFSPSNDWPSRPAYRAVATLFLDWPKRFVRAGRGLATSGFADGGPRQAPGLVQSAAIAAAISCDPDDRVRVASGCRKRIGRRQLPQIFLDYESTARASSGSLSRCQAGKPVRMKPRKAILVDIPL